MSLENIINNKTEKSFLFRLRNKITPYILSLGILAGAYFSNVTKSFAEELWINNTNLNSIKSLTIEGDYIWAGTEGGVFKWDRIMDVYSIYTIDDGLANNKVYSIFIDEKRNKWICTKGGGVSIFDGTNWTTLDTSDGLASNNVHAMTVDLEDNKWFGTSGGVSKFDGTNWTTYTKSDGLIYNVVYSIAVDSKGLIWIGTVDGLNTFNGTNWTTYTESDGLGSNWVMQIVIDSKGDKWFATYSGIGLSKFDGKNWTTYKESERALSLAIDSTGNKWIGTDYYGRGISKFDGIKWTHYKNDAGLPDISIRAIVVDSEDNKWFGTSEGLIKFDGETWKKYQLYYEKEIPDKYILYQNYPNPFNPETTIKYHIPELSYISLKIYNILGQEIRTLVAKEQSPGDYQVLWDGRNNAGQTVSGGIYLYQLKAGDFVTTKKLIFLK